MAQAPYRTQLRKRQQTEFWHRVNRLLFVLILLTIGGLVFLSFYPEWKRLKELRQNTRHLKEEQAKYSQLLKDKLNQVQWLQNDPEYLETIARDRLDMMKEGETIYRLNTKTNKPATNPQ